MGKFKNGLIIGGAVLLLSLMIYGTLFVKNKQEEKIMAIQEEQLKQKEETKLKEFQVAYLSGIKKVYDLTDNCQVVSLDIASTTKYLVDVSCAREALKIEVEKAQANCEKCEECKLCD